MSARPPRPGSGAGRDSKTDLLDAARAAIKDREEAAVAAVAAANIPKRRKRRLGTMALLGAIGAIVLVLQPDWLVGPDAPPPETPAVAAASLRVTLLRERGQVFAYLKQFGRLPETLTDAGVTTPGLSYQRIGATEFRLQARAGDSLLTLNAADSTVPFLGNSLKLIQARGRP
jgi:hypothetical protein